MPHALRDAQPTAGRTSLYAEITERIIAELEAGRLPWVQPWGASDAAASLGLPRNVTSGRTYSGVNVLILWGAVFASGFSGQGWLTYRQALSLGGNVRRGERSTTVVYTDRFIPDRERRRAREDGEEAQPIHFLKRFTVFNTDQCEGLPEDIAPVPPPIAAGLILPRAEALIRASGVDVRIGGTRAFYHLQHDYVQVPPPQAFFEPVNWHRTARVGVQHRPSQPVGPRPVRCLRLSQICLRGTGGGDRLGLSLRGSRHHAHRPACRLYRSLAAGVARGRSRHRPGRQPSQQGS
ncbi:Antirestriction protein [Azospirillum palustre]